MGIKADEARALDIMIPGSIKCAHDHKEEGKIDGIIIPGGV